MAWVTPRRHALLAVCAVVFASVLALPAGASGTEHGTVVGEAPDLSALRVLDGEVLAVEQVGNRIIVGGDFTQVEDATLGTVDQPYLAAYDVHTGRIDTNFRPDVSNQVNGIADAGEGSIVVVGQFRFIDGIGRDRVAKLRVVDGSVVAGFVADANAQVIDVAVANDRAYLGGSFARVNGQARSRLAAVNVHTGDVDAGFDLPITDPTGWEGAGSVRGLDVSPDGTMLATVHNDATVDGLPRQGVALIDISGPVASVLPWQTDLYDYDCQPWFPQFTHPLMRDVAFSPDGSYIVAVSAIGNFAPGCDVAVRFPTTGAAGVRPDWVSRMFDSPEAVAVSDAAVYVGGHMRWAMAPGTVWTDFADGNTNEQPDGTVVRDQLVALSPDDGTALDWDPGAGGLRGVLALETVAAGLLAGSDGNRWDGRQIGRHALFRVPAGPTAPDPGPPVSTFVNPVDDGVAGAAFPLIVETVDETGVADVEVTIRDTASGLYLQLDGGFAAPATDLSPLVLGIGSTRATTLGLFSLPAGSYRATAAASDVTGWAALPVAVDFDVSGGLGTVAPDGRFDHPLNHEILGSTVTLSGWAWDDTGIDKVRVIVRNLDTGEYLQNDGGFAAAFNRMWVLPDNRGEATSTYSWTWDLPDGKYRAWLHLKDADNTKDPVKARVNFRVEGDN